MFSPYKNKYRVTTISVSRIWIEWAEWAALCYTAISPFPGHVYRRHPVDPCNFAEEFITLYACSAVKKQAPGYVKFDSLSDNFVGFLTTFSKSLSNCRPAPHQGAPEAARDRRPVPDAPGLRLLPLREGLHGRRLRPPRRLRPRQRRAGRLPRLPQGTIHT